MGGAPPVPAPNRCCSAMRYWIQFQPGVDMIQFAPTRAFHAKDSANAALAFLNSESFVPDRKAHPCPFSTLAAITLPRACVKVDDGGLNANGAALASAPLRRPRSQVAIGDWDAMFGAVTARLVLIVAEPLPTTAASRPADAADRIRVAVLECVAALDQLHATLKHELGRRAR